jgi:hypothetical protein
MNLRMERREAAEAVKVGIMNDLKNKIQDMLLLIAECQVSLA